jgi:hypothetical protein
MPFDAIVVSESTTFAEYLANMGITPVPWSVLLDHKADQIRRHPPSMFLGYKPYLIFGVIVAVISREFMVADIPSNILTGWGSAAALFMFFSFFRLRGKARWIEWLITHEVPMPAPIRDILREVRASFPHVTVMYGELVQAKTVLDPYIIVEWKNERACLGIWDGETIIAKATKA